MTRLADVARRGWFALLIGVVATWSPGCDTDECVCDDDDDSATDDDVADDDTVDDDATGDDADGDGFTVEQGDCDDADPAIHPGTDEVCDDSVDSDCDGVDSGGCTVELAAGTVEVGSNETSVVVPGQFISYWDERPQHTVSLSAFAIDRYEVTNFQYRRCVAAGECTPPASPDSRTRPGYHADPAFGGFPVLNVTWQQARDHCLWRGGDLPTEAQWEAAAKGPSPANPQAPWGELVEIDDWYAHCDRANYGLCESDTTLIGSYESGTSVHGVYDLTGNAAEWVLDWYLVGYYGQSPAADPTGPPNGRFKVLRGGSWTQGWYDGRTVRRKYAEPDRVHDAFGFRCAFEGS